MTRLRQATLLAVLATCSLATAQEAAPVQEEVLPPELRPYRVSLAVEFESSPMFPVEFRRQVRRDVERLIDRTLGERWNLTIVDEAGLPDSATAIARLTATDLPISRRKPNEEQTVGFPLETAPDKFLMVSIATDGPGYVVVAREWDRLTDTLGPLQSNSLSTRSGIPAAVVTSLLAVFRPVALVGESEDTQVPLEFRASGIPTPDPQVAAIRAGQLLLPQLRGFDRDGQLDQIRDVPYTLLSVVKTDNGKTTAEIHSALRSALGSRRGRIEAWAIAALPMSDSTRVTLVRREDEVPLAGRIVEIRSKPFSPGEKPAEPDATLFTDRAGAVVLAADAKRPIVWLTIRSGTAVLMRIPLAPGIDPEIELAVGDDVRRLDAEGRLAILTGELVETVAKRATLLAKARAGARSGRYDEADAALAEAKKLPSAATFRRRIAAVATPASKEAEDAGDRLAAARIAALGRKASGLVDQYLKADILNATVDEVEELKRTDPNRDAKQTSVSDTNAKTR